MRSGDGVGVRWSLRRSLCSSPVTNDRNPWHVCTSAPTTVICPHGVSHGVVQCMARLGLAASVPKRSWKDEDAGERRVAVGTCA